jgi:hypothetical protein
MLRIHRSRSFSPVLNPLEGRQLLSGASGKVAIQGGAPLAQNADILRVSEAGIYKHHALNAVQLIATVEPLSGVGIPTGTVTFNTVTPAGTTELGTVSLIEDEAFVKVKLKMVLKMPLQVVYSGDATYAPSTATPPIVTKASFKHIHMSSIMV